MEKQDWDYLLLFQARLSCPIRGFMLYIVKLECAHVRVPRTYCELTGLSMPQREFVIWFLAHTSHSDKVLLIILNWLHHGYKADCFHLAMTTKLTLIMLSWICVPPITMTTKWNWCHCNLCAFLPALFYILCTFENVVY